jgi:uncharacterized protein (DUF305 family)
MIRDHHHAPAHGADADFDREMAQAMERMMQDMHLPPTGDPDRDFLAMMIPHHQGAVDMARLVLDHGRDPLTRQLAEQILASQATEIQAMQERLRRLAADTPDSYPALTGTRGTM